MSFLTLTETARILDVPQHRLIHLCEKGVVVPEGAGARGRGSSRRFSRRNVFEFAVALEMRKLELPVSFIQAVLRVLRGFEEALQSSRRRFVLPDSLLVPGAPRLALVILDGERLYFTLTPHGGRPIIYGGVDIRHPTARGRARKHRAVGRLTPASGRRALEEARTRTEVNLWRVAHDVHERDPRP